MRRIFASDRRPAWSTRFARWLRAVPLQDAVERRNAPMVQLLFLVVGIALPVLAALRWHRSWAIGIDVPRELAAVAATLIAWTALYLVRAGSFRHAVGLFLGGTLLLLAADYALAGLRAQVGEQAVHLLPLILGGLLLGRRMLWSIAAVLGLAVLIGGARDLWQVWPWPVLRPAVWFELARTLFGLLAVTLVFDRAVAALRDSLAMATHRGDELARTRDQLEREVMARERSQAQLVHAQRMEAVGRLASGVAHDFNNLLGVILGYVGRARSTHDAAVADDALDGIRGAAQRGALVTRRLLSLSRNEPRRPLPLELGATLRDVAPLLRQLLGELRPVELALPPDPVHVRLDRHELELALLNMAANARDAMPDGGTLQLRLAREGRAWAVLHVIDTGHGLSEESRRRLFEAFYTTKPSGEGTGLGLAVVQRLVTDAGGRIDVGSAPGKGTTFELRFPLLPANAATPQVSADTVALVVEDDAQMRALAAQALRDAGWNVVTAADVASAGDALAQLSSLAAIVSDFDLPDGTANDVFARVATRFPSARRVVVSGLDRRADVADTHATDVQHVRKPFDAAQLVRAVVAAAAREPQLL